MKGLLMAARLPPMTPIYPKGFSGQSDISPLRQRQPRKRHKRHLACIANLPCTIPDCKSDIIHVAHIRFASAADGASLTGKGQKPDDWRTVPLCGGHHLYGPQAQHAGNEEYFWRRHGINPYGLSRALYNITGDIEKMRFLVHHAGLFFPNRDEL